MATDSPAVAFLSGINDLVADLEKKYSQQIQEQKKIINELRDEIEELKSVDPDDELQRLKSVDIDDILDEIEMDEKYDDTPKQNSTKRSKHKHKKSVSPSAYNDEDSDDEDNISIKKSHTFWGTLEEKLKERDLEYIKDLVRRNELKMDESNYNGRTLLMFATFYGSYDLVSMCINLGSHIDKVCTIYCITCYLECCAKT